MALRHQINDVVEALLRRSRRLDRYYRDGFDHVFRAPIVSLTQLLIRATRARDRLEIAEEREMPDEDGLAREIVEHMCAFMAREYQGGVALRAGNTKTHGLLRARFEVLPDLPPPLARGLFRSPCEYPAWVRVAGPGPLAPADLDDNGILSLSVKIMAVEGAKLLDDERATQDFTCISAPTFTTPNVRENLKLQRRILDRTPSLYFLDPRDSHLLDAVMQGVYARAHGNPLDLQYYSCVPYLHGPGAAVKYMFSPCVRQGTKVPRRPGPHYLRDAMTNTLREREVAFDFRVQLQTDPSRMPIEDASVIWPERLSPWRSLARLHIPPQSFASPEQMRFDRYLSFNPWHALADHRPLGNQNRVRRQIYRQTSAFRQRMNADNHVEPTGSEVFETDTGRRQPDLLANTSMPCSEPTEIRGSEQ
jgi:hypothetical protein